MIKERAGEAVEVKYILENKTYLKEELENKILKELEENLEVTYNISKYNEKYKRRDVVVNENQMRYISQINIRNPN